MTSSGFHGRHVLKIMQFHPLVVRSNIVRPKGKQVFMKKNNTKILRYSTTLCYTFFQSHYSN